MDAFFLSFGPAQTRLAVVIGMIKRIKPLNNPFFGSLFRLKPKHFSSGRSQYSRSQYVSFSLQLHFNTDRWLKLRLPTKCILIYSARRFFLVRFSTRQGNLSNIALSSRAFAFEINNINRVKVHFSLELHFYNFTLCCGIDAMPAGDAWIQNNIVVQLCNVDLSPVEPERTAAASTSGVYWKMYWISCWMLNWEMWGKDCLSWLDWRWVISHPEGDI